MTVGKLFHRDAGATANEQSTALVRVRFTCNMLLFAERSVLVGLYGHMSSHKYTVATRATHNQPGSRVLYSL